MRGHDVTDVTIKGLAELRATLRQFSDRRFNAAVATALSRTAVIVRDQMRRQMEAELDRPTKYTLGSLYTVPATAQTLDAKVRFRDDKSISNGTPATYFLGPEVRGGPRREKGFELALQSLGVLPRGWLAVPGKGAPLDQHGNMSKGYIGQIIRGLSAQRTAGPLRARDLTKRIAAQRAAGGSFFAIPPGGKTQPGVYLRDFIGRNITPVLIFVQRATYRKRFKFYEGGQDLVGKHLPGQVERAVSEHLQRLAARNK